MYIALLLYLVYQLKYGLKGIWLAKIITEVFNLIAYYITITCQDWDKCIKMMREDFEEQ